MALGGIRLDRIVRWLRPVLVGVLLLLCSLVVVLGFRVHTALDELHEQPTDNIQWNTAQLELDLVLFGNSVHDARSDASLPLENVRKRFDLFYSRAQNAIGGEAFIRPGMNGISKDLSELLASFLARETPKIDAPDESLREALPMIQSDIEALRAALRKSTIELVARLAKLNDVRRANFAELVQELAWAAGAAIATLTLLVSVIIWFNAIALRQTRAAARVSERLAATVDSALDAIIVIDHLGRVLQYNPSAATIFGFPREEIVGETLAGRIIPERHRAAHIAGMAKASKGGKLKVVGAGRFEITALHKSGREFPIELAISQAMGDSGPIYIAFLRDITDRLAAEASLRAARDEALAAERAKDNFLAVMSHEMRTPLNGVIASLEIAAQDARHPRQARFIDLARSSATQLLRHANDVLDIARLESGAVQVAHEDFDLGHTLAVLLDAIRPISLEKGIELKLDMLGDIPPLHGDPFRLGQIVQNFLSNAIKFVETGGVTVEAEATRQTAGQCEIEIRVSDTGPGIAEADQQRIFDDFVMLDPSFGRTGEGAGLGLSICRRLAKAIGGEIGVESALGEGSCFWLRVALPLAHGNSDAPALAIETEVPQLDVLVVEDNQTNRELLEEMLRRLGQRVVLRNDGKTGSDEARTRHYDLILMDVSMPVMDGIAATQAIRSDGASRDSRILAVTAHSMPADLERFRAAGMDDTLVKPISMAGLRKVLLGQTGVTAVSAVAVLDAERQADLRTSLAADVRVRILTRFLADSGTLIERIVKGAGEGLDAQAMMALCHEAAGSAAVVGATRLQQHFATAEVLFRDGHAKVASGVLTRETPGLWLETSAAIQATL